jgi:hypothetical protein
MWLSKSKDRLPRGVMSIRHDKRHIYRPYNIVTRRVHVAMPPGGAEQCRNTVLHKARLSGICIEMDP